MDCYDCEHCIAWTEYGTPFTDCKLSETDPEHLEWVEDESGGVTDIHEIGARCSKIKFIVPRF
jgi:hypothetical protein